MTRLTTLLPLIALTALAACQQRDEILPGTRLDPEALTTGATLSETRAAAEAAKAKPEPAREPAPVPAVANHGAEPPAPRGLLSRLFGKG